MKPPPCRMADASMAPNISPPGSRSRQTTSADAVDDDDQDGKLRIDAGGPAATKRAIRPPSAVSPK